MHVQRITADIIKSFNECTSMRDYTSFYYNYETSIKSSAEDFKLLNVSYSNRCHFITQNFLLIFKFLKDYPHSDPNRFVCYTVETGDPEFVKDMKAAINWRDWNSFYQKYSKIADVIIEQAREQKVLNISIEWNRTFYSNFEAIENAKSSCHPYTSKNSGEMLKNRPGHSPHSSIIRQYPRTPSPIRSTESTPQRRNSFYREARDKYSPPKNYDSGIFLRTESHSNVNGMSSNQNQNAPASEILLNATTLTQSDNSFSRSTYLPGATNGSYNVGISPTPSRVSTISHGDTGCRREVGHSFGPLHFDYTNSQQPNHVERSLHSSHYKGSPKSYGAPVANPDNTGILDCCRSSSRTTHELEYNTTTQWNQGSGRATATNFDSPVVTRQPAAISNDHPPTYKPLVPPHKTNDAPYYPSEENPREGYSKQSQSHIVHPLQQKEESRSQQLVDNFFDNSDQYSHQHESSPRPGNQAVENNYNIAQGCDRGSVQSANGYQNKQWQDAFVTLTTPEPSREQKHIQSYQSSNVTPSVTAHDTYDQQFHSLPSRDSFGRGCTHPQISSQNLEPLVADTETPHSGVYNLHDVPNQTSSSDTTHSSKQELPQSQTQLGPEIRGSTLKVEIPTEHTSTLGAETVASPQASPHQEIYGGYSMQPQSVVPNQTPIADNTRSDYKVLLLSKSLEQPSSENIDSTLRTGWPEAPETTTISGDEARVLGDTHPELNGGIAQHSQAAVRNQNWSSENHQSSYQVPRPSESLEEPDSETINNTSLSSGNGKTLVPTTTPQDFSLMNDSADMETLKQHDASFENLGNDTARPDDEERYKISSEEFEVVDDHRSSMSSLHIDFSPVEDSVISHQSCFDLDDLRRQNDTPIESTDENFDDELFKHQAEMNQVNREVGRTEHLIAKELEDMQRQQTIRPNNSDLTEEEDDNSDFNRQLEEIKRKHAEELRRIREERRRKQQKLDEELQKMRQESKERFKMFMTCIILKQRFEQQEDKWKDWIRDCRNNIVTLQKYFLLFEETYRRVFTGSKKKQPDSDDLEDFESEKGNFSRYVINTYNALETDFETLKNIEQHYNDAMFLRVLQKCIADVAQMILEISDTLFSLNSDSFSKLDEQMSKLHIDLIYSTTKLRSVCSQAENWKYQDVQFPRTESNYNFEEI
ncbi:unnamed protein product [Caenorhabditis brenneri]